MPKHLSTFVTTLATGIAMTAVDSSCYYSELRVM